MYTNLDASIYQQRFLKMRDRYRDYIPVYTDGSRDENSVAFGSLSIGHRIFFEKARFGIYFHCRTLSNLKALEEIQNASAFKFTDSLSCLQGLLYMKLEHP